MNKKFCFKRLIVKNLIFSILTIFLLTKSLGAISLAQKMKLRSWTVDDDLPSNNITDVIQDSKGYIWIGSYDGLARFDGVKFRHYNKYENENCPFVAARVIAEDKNGSIVVGSNGEGVIIFNPVNDLYQKINTDNGLSNNSIRKIFVDSKNNIWVGSANGLNLIKNNKVTTFKNVFFKDVAITSIYEDGNILISTSNGKTLKYDNKENQFIPIKILNSLVVSSVIENENNFWFGTRDNGIVVIDKNLNTVVNKFTSSKELSSNKINSLSKQKSGAVLIATDQGLTRYFQQEFEYYKESDGLPNNLVEKAMEDNEKSIWLATSRGGLAQLSFSKFVSLNNLSGLVHNKTNCIVEDKDGAFWIGTDKGLSKFENNRFNDFEFSEYLKNVRIRHLFFDSDENLWISTYSENIGLAKVNLKNNKIKSYTTSTGLAGNRIRTVFEKSDGTICVGTTSGFSQINANDQIISYNNEEGLLNDYVMCLAENNDGSLLLGTDGGGVFRLYNNKIMPVIYNNKLPSKIIFKLLYDNENKLWISTGGGICVVMDGKVYSNSRLKQLALANFQAIITKDKQIWLTTSRGVYRINKSELFKSLEDNSYLPKIEDFNKSDGLLNGVTATSWGICDLENKVWLPTIGGVSYYNQNSNFFESMKPPVVIEFIKFNDKIIKNTGKVIKFNAGTRRLEFVFTALSFINPQKLKFSYFLEGNDQKWSAPQVKRSVSYTNLKPGTYSFMVKALSQENNWSDEEKIVFTIQPHFYQTTLFYLIILAILLIIASSYHFTKLNILKIRKKELEILVKNRTSELVKEKDKSEKLLSSILPEKVVKELKENGSTEPEVFENVTILVSDLIDFTSKSALINPKILLNELNIIFSGFDNIVKKYNCERIKTVGDSYICVAGLFNKSSDHAVLSAKIALEMIRFLKDLKDKKELNWQIRIGMSSGTVIGGVVGKEKYIYDIFGDAVNVATRMEQNSKAMKINVSEDTYEMLKEQFCFIEREPMMVKGKGRMKMYFLEKCQQEKSS